MGSRSLIRSLPLPLAAAALLAAAFMRAPGGDAPPPRVLGALLAGPKADHALPEAQPVRCLLRGLPQSPLARRNLSVALDRLNGLIVASGDSISLAAVLGPWCAEGYVLAPCSGQTGCVAAFGAGAEEVGDLACQAAQAAGLKVTRPVSRDAFEVEPVSADILLSNVTSGSVRFSTGWEGSLPCLEIRRTSGATHSPGGFAAMRPSSLLAAVGDVACDPAAAPWIGRSGAAAVDSDVVPVLRSADLCVGNLETPLTDSSQTTPVKSASDIARKREFVFGAAPVRGLAILTGLGLDVAACANNHIFDRGEQGIADTLRNLSDREITPCGPSSDPAISATPAVELGGSRLRFVAFATTETLPPGAESALPGSWVLDVREGKLGEACSRVSSVIRQCASQGEMPVVSFHWGVERSHRPTRVQLELARAAAESGAGLILGHHPHRLQPVDMIGECVVAYSLGNFVFAPQGEGQDRSAILLVRVAHGRPVAAGLTPATISHNGLPQLARDSRPDALVPLLAEIGVEAPAS